MSIDPKIASLRGQIAANTRCSRPDYDGQAATRKATDGYWAKLEAEVDPDGKLAPEERRRRAVSLWKARMARGKLKRQQSRNRKSRGTDKGGRNAA